MANNTSHFTAKLLAAGIIAGPLFVIVALVHGLLRPGFNIIRHPASLLSLGDLGWIQISNFVLTGIFYLLAAIGLRRQLQTGIGSTWAPRLFAVFGFALIVGGVFTADPGLGFPPGAPQGPPAVMSWHGVVHGFAPVVGFLSLAVALFILARRFGSQRQQGWKYSTIFAAVAMFVLSAIPNFTADWEKGVFNFLPLWAGTILGFGWTSLVVAKIKQEQQARVGAQVKVGEGSLKVAYRS